LEVVIQNQKKKSSYGIATQNENKCTSENFRE